MEREGDGDTNCRWCTWNNPQRNGEVTGRLGNKKPRGDHLKYNIIMIVQNTGKSPEDLSRLNIPQTPGKTHQLMLV